jgi:hypothetical protein
MDAPRHRIIDCDLVRSLPHRTVEPGAVVETFHGVRSVVSLGHAISGGVSSPVFVRIHIVGRRAD